MNKHIKCKYMNDFSEVFSCQIEYVFVSRISLNPKIPKHKIHYYESIIP